MTLSRVAALVGIALLVMVSNVALSVVYMVIYGHVIDTGHEKAYYEAHIQVAAPYCSIVAGIPLMILAGWWVRRFWENAPWWQSAMVVWLAYALIDLAIVAASGMTARIGVLFTVSFVTKLAAALFGAWLAERQR